MTRRKAFQTFNLILCFLAFLCVDSLGSQNIVGHTTAQFTANPVRLTDTDVSEFFLQRPDLSAHPESPEARRIAWKLDAHIAAFVNGAPWMPFHRTLCSSGYETSFSHPDVDVPWCQGDFYFVEKRVYATVGLRGPSVD